ncbi:polyprenyl synthetase [Streptomyces sp. KS 21]|nr:polyprenyl synthetase [Streptomyces sp. KS 21]
MGFQSSSIAARAAARRSARAGAFPSSPGRRTLLSHCPIWMSRTAANKAVQDLIDGEYADVTFQDRPAVPRGEAQAMAQAKTGALIAATCELGALAGGADDARTELLGAFGSHLGAASQLTDDLLGIWGDPEATGKPRWSDLSARNKSLPIAHSLASGNAAGQALARLYATPGSLSQRQLEQSAVLVEEAGGRAWATSEAHRHIETALHHLQAAEQFLRGSSDGNPSTNAHVRRRGSTRTNRPAIRPIRTSNVSCQRPGSML